MFPSVSFKSNPRYIIPGKLHANPQIFTFQMPNSVLSVDDIPSMGGLLEVVVILWRSIHKALDRNEGAKNHIVKKFASVLGEYFKVFKVTPLSLNYTCIL